MTRKGVPSPGRDEALGVVAPAAVGFAAKDKKCSVPGSMDIRILPPLGCNGSAEDAAISGGKLLRTGSKWLGLGL